MHHADTQQLRSEDVRFKLERFTIIREALLSEYATHANIFDRQLGREGQAEEDNRHRPHALPKDSFSIVQEWFPDRYTKGRERSLYKGGVVDHCVWNGKGAI